MYAKNFVKDYQHRLTALLSLPENATGLDLHTYIQQGVPLKHVANLLNQVPIDLYVLCGVNLIARLACLQVSSTALQNQRLSPDEGDRLLRALHAVVITESIFGNREKALRWLSTPKQRFDGRSPIEMLNTYIGATLVEELLVQMADGLTL